MAWHSSQRQARDWLAILCSHLCSTRLILILLTRISFQTRENFYSDSQWFLFTLARILCRLVRIFIQTRENFYSDERGFFRLASIFFDFREILRLTRISSTSENFFNIQDFFQLTGDIFFVFKIVILNNFVSSCLISIIFTFLESWLYKLSEYLTTLPIMRVMRAWI